MGVLKAVLYAHGQSSSFEAQSFLEVATIFFSILLFSLFETLACPFVHG